MFACLLSLNALTPSLPNCSPPTPPAGGDVPVNEEEEVEEKAEPSSTMVDDDVVVKPSSDLSLYPKEKARLLSVPQVTEGVFEMNNVSEGVVAGNPPAMMFDTVLPLQCPPEPVPHLEEGTKNDVVIGGGGGSKSSGTKSKKQENTCAGNVILHPTPPPPLPPFKLQ